jgi:glycosyltransferase involved in cell wall biosynthesis
MTALGAAVPSTPKILYICHNHPANRPGGAEAYAVELYTAMRDQGDFDPVLLARAGPPMTTKAGFHANTRLAIVGNDPGQYMFYTDRGEVNMLFGTAEDKSIYTEHFREFLLAHEPDIVHFQHTLFLGYDLIREVRNTLPHVPIVYTLHEYLPICHRNGQMVREGTNELCHAASPARCHGCFPKIPPENFFLRERFVKAQFELVDLFIAPSQFLRQRYVEWGIPPEKIRFEDYGRHPVTPLADPPRNRVRNRLGFFGQFTRFKGVDVLLQAMKILTEEGEDVQLRLHGANLEYQPQAYQDQINQLLEETAETSRFLGRYEHTQLPSLLAGVDWVVIPSIWWENSPLVIQESFMYGRPVICSDIGGMAEKVRNGIDGLHFSVGDAQSLADAIRLAVSTPGLWEEMRAQIRGAHPMDRHLQTMSEIYRALLEAAPQPAPA